MLKINEILLTIQGESTYAGCPCVLVRLTGCNLRCTYCDSEYAFYDGVDRDVNDVLEQVSGLSCDIVCITGGEPLMQDDVYPLMDALLGGGRTVLLETNGSLPIGNIPDKVITIMDIKTPHSGCEPNNLYDNIRFLKEKDELKFVICSRDDYTWAVNIVKEYDLESVCTVLFSPAWGLLEADRLASWILHDKIQARLQIQLHKIIWHGKVEGI